jgi:ferric-dicitrate binding protein FerR (iron transport regulator)
MESHIEIWLPEGAETLELRPPEMKRFALPGSSELHINQNSGLDPRFNPKGRWVSS